MFLIFSQARLDLQVDEQNGSFNLTVDGEMWFQQSLETLSENFVHVVSDTDKQVDELQAFFVVNR